MPRPAEQGGEGSSAAELWGMITMPGRLADDWREHACAVWGWATTSRSDTRSRTVHVGEGDAAGVSGWPLHELDSVAVRVGQPGCPEPRSRLGGRFGRYAPGREIRNRRVEIVVKPGAPR